MILWDSENDRGPYPATEDCFYIAIDENNGVLRLADYESTGAHTTNLGFLGPEADQNAKKWDEFEPSEGLKIKAEIQECFGLG